MRVRVRFFAGTREAVGRASLDVDVAEGASIAQVVDVVCAAHPRLAAYRPHALFALGGAFVPPATSVPPGAEIAIMPPVSGGALQEDAFSVDALVGELERAGAGAVVAFVGYVRADGGVERLTFEAYAPMAEREIQAVRAEAVAKFGLSGCVVRHRIATLAVGEPIVCVVTAAPHRREAFEAAAWVMDQLKSRVPIWKAEVSADGSRWVNDPTGGRVA